MFEALKKILGFGPKTDFKVLLQHGAQIIDVRSPAEFAIGHVKQAINIPLPELSKKLTKIKKGKPVITCCASGMRSASAKSILLNNGFTTVYNGGGWQNLQNHLQ